MDEDLAGTILATVDKLQNFVKDVQDHQEDTFDCTTNAEFILHNER